MRSPPISSRDPAEEKTAKELPPNLSKVTFKPHARLPFDSQSPRTSNERDARNVRLQRVAAIQPPLPRQYPTSSLNPSSKASSSLFSSSVRPSFLPLFPSARLTAQVPLLRVTPATEEPGYEMLSFYEGRIRVYDGIKSAMRRVNTPPNCNLHFMGFVNENWVRFYYQTPPRPPQPQLLLPLFTTPPRSPRRMCNKG